MPRYVYLSIHEEQDNTMEKIAVALSSKIRRDILRLVDEKSYNISEIAHKLDLPISTVAFHIKHLREADMIHVQERMMTRGVEKIVSRKIDEVIVKCTAPPKVSPCLCCSFRGYGCMQQAPRAAFYLSRGSCTALHGVSAPECTSLFW